MKVETTPFATIEAALEDIREGKFVVVVDAADRENEGDLTIAAQFATPEAVNFMVTHARGLVCLCLTEERCDELHLTTQVADNTSFLGTAFTISIDARRGITTGISAADRAHVGRRSAQNGFVARLRSSGRRFVAGRTGGRARSHGAASAGGRVD